MESITSVGQWWWYPFGILLAKEVTNGLVVVESITSVGQWWRYPFGILSTKEATNLEDIYLQ